MNRNDPDVELVRQAAAGDNVAAGKLYEQYIQPIYAFCYRQVGNVEVAEDITQEVFIAALKGLSGFKFESTFRTWLYQVARNHVMDYWRRIYKNKILPLDFFLNMDIDNPKPLLEEDRVELANDQREKDDKVEKIFDLLPDNYRRVLELRFLKSYSLKETAAEMGKTVNNIKVMQYRAIKKATVIADELYGESV